MSILAALTAGPGLGLVVAVASPAFAVAACVPTSVAHRGGYERAPESTLSAYRAALRGGTRFVEADVRLTRDHVPVILHDSTVDRTTDGTGPVEEMTFEEARELDAGNGERIPSLSEVLALAGRYGAELLLELKRPGLSRYAVRRFVAPIRAARAGSRVTIQSWHAENLRLARDLAPRIRRGLIVMRPRALRVIRSLGDVVVARFEFVSTRLVRRWKRSGLTVHVWTANDRPTWRAMADASVDGVITDLPLAYQAWATRRCS